MAADLEGLMKDHGFSYSMVGRELGISSAEAKRRVLSRDLKLSQLIRLLDLFGVEPYIIMRPQIAWVKM